MKFGYTIIYVDDVKATLDFYVKAFNQTIGFYHESGTYGELATGDTKLAFAHVSLADEHVKDQYQAVSTQQKPFGIEIAFVTEDLNASYQQALTNGAIAVKAPEVKPWGQAIAYVRAREGTLIELCTPVTA